MSKRGPSFYGRFYWIALVPKTLSMTGWIGLHADHAEVGPCGSLTFSSTTRWDDGTGKYEPVDPPPLIVLSLSAGSWLAYRAASVWDGSPLGIEWWPGQAWNDSCDDKDPSERATEDGKKPTKTKGGGNGNGRQPLEPSYRYKIIKRDGGKCVLCGRGPRQGVSLEVDHIVSVSNGGGNEESNLRTLCWHCNRGKGPENG